MAQVKEPSETSPLLPPHSPPTKTLEPETAPNGSFPDNFEAQGLESGHGHGEGGEDGNDGGYGLEDPSGKDADYYEGLPEVMKKLKWILPGVALGVFLSACDQTIIASSYSTIGSDFGSLNNMSWIATSYLMTMTCFQPLYGKLSDIFGRKPVLLFSYAMLGAGCLLCGLAQNLSQLIAGRAIAGVGGAANSLVAILLSDIVPMRERGTWQSFINLVFAAGASLGAPLGGLIADRLSWRWTFLGQVPLCALTFILVYLTLHLPSRDETNWRSKIRRVDFLGALSLIAALFSLLLGLDRGSNVSFIAPIAIVPSMLFQPFIALFFWIERKYAVEPIAPMRIILDRSLLAGYLCNFFSLAGWFGAVFYIPLYYQAVQRLNAFDAGIRLLPAIIAAVLGSLASGIIIQKTGRYYRVLLTGYMLMLIGSICILLFMRPMAYSEYGIWTGLILGGLGNGIGLTTSLIALISNAPAPSDVATITAVSYLFRSLGTVIGLALLSTALQYTLRQQIFKSLLSGSGRTGEDNLEDLEKIVQGVRKNLGFVDKLKDWERDAVRQAYVVAIRRVMGGVVAFMGAAVVSSC